MFISHSATFTLPYKRGGLMIKFIMQVKCLPLIVLVGIAIAGCGGPNAYIHPNPGLDRIKRIAVVSFDNFSKDDKAGEKVRNGFVIELLRTGSFNVVDIWEVDRILREAGTSYSAIQESTPADSMTSTKADATDYTPLSKRIGELLNAEAILIGSVEEYSAERVGDLIIPEVSISVRLIDAETGIIIWASTYTRRGRAGFPILGWGKNTSLGILSQQVVQDMVDSLANHIK